MADLQLPTVLNGAPVDADAWYNPVAEALQEHEDDITSIEAAWPTWTPTLTNITQGDGLLLAKYLKVGKTLHYRWKLTLGSTSAIGTSPRFTLPFAPHSDYTGVDPMGDVQLRDAGTANRRGSVLWISGSTVEIFSYSTTGVLSFTTATFPHTWAATDEIGCAGTIELA